MTHHLPKTLLSWLLLWALLAPMAWAQFGGDPHTQARLVLERTQTTANEPLRGVLVLKMDDEWHTYWKNAGDVGLPTEVAWTLPPGWSADPLLWPAPEYLDTSGLISFAYEHQVSLPFLLRPSAEVRPGPQQVTAKVSWLECKEACIPGEATLQVSFEVADQAIDGPEAALVAEGFAALPSPRTDLVASREGTHFLLHLPTDLSQATSYRFFPDAAMQVSLSAPQELLTLPDGSQALKLAPEPTAEKPPEQLSGVLTVTRDGTSSSYEFTTPLSAQRPAPPAAAAGLGTVLFTLGAAFVGGLILNLMPCVFPVLSLKVLSIVEQSRQEGNKAWHHGLVFALGVLVSFWVLSGVLLVVRQAGQEVGWGYHLQNPLMIAFLAFLFLLIGLNLFGVFEVGENLTQLSNVADRKQGFAHSFWSGVLTTLAATPCTAPFMGGAVGFALSQPAFVALLIFSALALGVAAPYVTLTLFPSLLRKLPRPGPWMITFKQILAFPMLLAVVWLVWVFGSQQGSDRMAVLLLALLTAGLASWVYGHWGTSMTSRTRRLGSGAALLVMLSAGALAYQASQIDRSADRWQSYSPELVDRLVAEGQPVFLDFTADWCTSCKANELVTLSRADVQAAFESRGVALVKGDWTKKDPVITAALAKFGRAGVPLYVLYPGDGQEPIVLPEVLFPDTVLKALQNIRKAS